MNRPRWLCLLLLSACLASCGPRDAAGPHRGGTLRLTLRDAPSLDPFDVEDPWAAPFQLLLYEGLVRFDSTSATVRPAHAERWEVSSDGLLYTFRLRPGRRYEGGRPIVAADYVRTFGELFRRRPLSPARARFWSLAGAMSERFRRGDPDLGVEAPDPLTVVFRLATPDARFLTKLAGPAYALPLPERHDPERDPLPASGPYRVERADRRLLFLRNPDYAGEEPSWFDTIAVRLQTSSRSAIQLLASGDADVVWPEPAGQAERLRRERGITRVQGSAEGGWSYLLILNGSVPPTSKPEVRRALALGLDRTDLGSPWIAWQELSYGGETRASFPAFDAEAVRDELTAARLVRGLSLPIHVVRDSDEERLAAALIPGLARAGIHAELRPLRRDAKRDAMARRAGFAAAVWEARWGERRDIPWEELLLDRALDPSWGGNLAHFFQGGEPLDTLLLRAAAGADGGARRVARREVLEFLGSGGPFLPLARARESAWVRTDVQNLVLHPVYGPLWGGAWRRPKAR